MRRENLLKLRTDNPPTPFEMRVMANHCYPEGAVVIPAGWERLSYQQQIQFRGTENFNLVVYRRLFDGTVVIAIRRIGFKSMEDPLDGFDLAAGLEPAVMENLVLMARDAYGAIIRGYSDISEILFTGQSSAGSVAALAALYIGVRATVFDHSGFMDMAPRLAPRLEIDLTHAGEDIVQVRLKEFILPAVVESSKLASIFKKTVLYLIGSLIGSYLIKSSFNWAAGVASFLLLNMLIIHSSCYRILIEHASLPLRKILQNFQDELNAHLNHEVEPNAVVAAARETEIKSHAMRTIYFLKWHEASLFFDKFARSSWNFGVPLDLAPNFQRIFSPIFFFLECIVLCLNSSNKISNFSVLAYTVLLNIFSLAIPVISVATKGCFIHRLSILNRARVCYETDRGLRSIIQPARAG